MQIEVRQLTKVFGPLRANDRITLSFAGGQVHGILGENGAGKSTLMKLLSGFLRRDGGEVLLNGAPATLNGPADALQAGIGMVHQDPLDVPAFSVLENALCASPPGVFANRAAARTRLNALGAQLGFNFNLDTLVGRLTVGQRQQIEIVRLLACGAKVLILDEPTTGITAAQKVALFAAAKRLVVAGNTVLFVSHKLEDVAELCDTVSVLRAGRVVETQLAMPQPQATLLRMMFGELADERPAAADQPPVYQNGTAAGFNGRAALPANGIPPPEPQAHTGASVWALRNLALREGPLELSGLDLAVAGGTVLGLAGLDGSGQQLVLRALAGLLRPLRGQITLAGIDVTGTPPAEYRDAGVEYLPADRMADGIVGALDLTDHMALKQRAWLVDQRAAEAAASAAIATYNIKGTPHTPLASLSGGNQQRSMLALMPDRCSGILLDQPTRGLDITSAKLIWGRLLERRAHGSAIVFASADLDELLDYSDAVIVFCGGQVSAPLPRAGLTAARLAELIGGVGFVPMGAEER